MEYKVHVDAAKEDCYWQYVHKGATFYMSSQVLKGKTTLTLKKEDCCTNNHELYHSTQQVAMATLGLLSVSLRAPLFTTTLGSPTPSMKRRTPSGVTTRSAWTTVLQVLGETGQPVHDQLPYKQSR